MAPVVVTLIALVVVLVGLPRLAARSRRRGVDSGSVMGPFEELWHPAAVRARHQIEVQEERREPAPSPGDRLRRRWVLPDLRARRSLTRGARGARGRPEI